MKLTINGKCYQSDYGSLGRLTIGEARVLKRELGLSLKDLEKKFRAAEAPATAGSAAGQEPDLDLFVIIAYLMISRAGTPIPWDELDRIPIEDLAKGFDFADELPAPPSSAATPTEVPADPT